MGQLFFIFIISVFAEGQSISDCKPLTGEICRNNCECIWCEDKDEGYCTDYYDYDKDSRGRCINGEPNYDHMKCGYVGFNKITDGVEIAMIIIASISFVIEAVVCCITIYKLRMYRRLRGVI